MRKLRFVCIVSGCNAEIWHNHLMCNQHWSLVNPYIRSKLKQSWNSGSPTKDYDTYRKMALIDAEKDGELYDEKSMG